jgi:hypothetical protein
MSSTEIIVIAAVFAFLGFRLYQKYVKKDDDKAGISGKADKIKKSTSFPSYEKEDDYEPYSKQ